MLKKRADLEKKVLAMPSNCRSIYRKAMSGKSRNAAIRAFCQECMGYENFVREIRGCTAPLCPLYEYRPYK